MPSGVPSLLPSQDPTGGPTVTPSARPSDIPSSLPSQNPTGGPTQAPSDESSSLPSFLPSQKPTGEPTFAPSSRPSVVPSSVPSQEPTGGPTLAPSDEPSSLPSSVPSQDPTGGPTLAPSSRPSDILSSSPSLLPSSQPSQEPTDGPTVTPSSKRSDTPSSQPSQEPTDGPTFALSDEPSSSPSSLPSREPTGGPTLAPSGEPSVMPSSVPSQEATGGSTLAPSTHPSDADIIVGADSNTDTPTTPSQMPSLVPSQSTESPSSPPTTASPSDLPSMSPSTSLSTTGPSQRPSIIPSLDPTWSPTVAPTTSRPTTQGERRIVSNMSIGFNETSRRERRLTVSDILDDVETQFDGYLRQQVEQQVELSTHNVGIISVNSDVSTGEFWVGRLCCSGVIHVPECKVFMYCNSHFFLFYALNFYSPTEPCTASQAVLGYDACMIITTSIELSFNQGMSPCELEFIVLGDLSVVVPTMFIDFDTIEIWPQVGLSNNQFLLQGVDRPPDDDEKASFEGVVANYLVDALGNDAMQSILSVCVDVVNTKFVDGNGDDMTSSSAEDGSLTSAATDSAVAGRLAPVKTIDNLSGDSSGIVTRTDEDTLPSQNSQDNIFGHNVRLEQNIFRKENGRLANGSGLRLLTQKADAVIFDTVVSGRYRGPKIDMEKKVSDVISGNEYQIIEELKEEQPEYFNLEGEDGQSSVLLTLQPPSSNTTGTSTEAPDTPAMESESRMMRWRGLMGYFALGIAMVVLMVCTANLVVRRIRGDKGSSDAVSLQSILFTPALEMDGHSTAESTVGSTTTASSLSIPTVLATSTGTSNEDSTDFESDDSSIAIIKSILRGGEDSIVKKEAMWGVGLKTTRRRVRWALGFDESSSGSKSGSSKSKSSDSGEHSGPGAYHVIPDMSGGVITSLRELFRKSRDGDSTRNTVWTAEELLDASFDGSNNDGVENEADESADSSDDEEEGGNSSSNSSSRTPSFAQFSVYGTALMCSQREADGMIITDKKGTAELMEEVEIATAAVIAEQLTRDNFIVRTPEEEHGDGEGAGVDQ